MEDGQGLYQIVEELGLGGLSTIFRWLDQNRSFGDKYAQARERQADAMDCKINKIGEDVIAKTIDPASARVALEAFKWRAERLKPKVYGAQGQVTHISSTAGELQRLTTEELRDMKARLLAPVIEEDGTPIKPKKK